MVNRLIGIADDKKIGSLARQQRKNFNLRKIRVLKFIDQQKANAAALFLQQRRIIS
jgi:hypothetical protein